MQSGLRSGAAAQGAVAADARRTAVLVTGMHRNGTSALARTLSLIGAALPADLVPANEGNPDGHWEPRAMVDLNDRMLADAGSDLYGAVDIAPGWFSSPAADRFAAEAARTVERAFGDDRLILLKDPRTALLAPVWNRALAESGYRVVHVLPLRHPTDVAASLRRRHLKSFPYDAWAKPRGEAVWLRYTLSAVRGSRGHDRAFLRYADLLGDWRGAVARIGRDLGIAWPRLGPEAEREVDGFLRANDRADGAHAPVEAEGSALRDLDLAGLASACFDELVRNGDGSRLDAIGEEYDARIGGARDLVETLEGLYPLVWHHWEAAQACQGRLDAALAAEADLRGTVGRHWAALTAADADRRHLHAALGSRDREIVGLRAALDRPAAGGDAAAEAAGAERALHDAEVASLRRQVSEARDEAAALAAGSAALRASTSWRVTAPLRALSRAVRGRP